MGIKDKVLLWSVYHNPLHYWWGVRKHFKRPRAHFVHGKYYGYFGLPIRTYYGMLNLHCVGLGWKDKFDTPRHEWDPIICLTFTSPFKTKRKSLNGECLSFRQQYWIGWIFNWVEKDDSDSHVRSMATWEALLDMAVYGKTLEFARNNHVRAHGNYYITIDTNLKGIDIV